MSATIYLHWTATPYDWVRSGLYHSIISGDGQVHRLHSYAATCPPTPGGVIPMRWLSAAPAWAAGQTLGPSRPPNPS